MKQMTRCGPNGSFAFFPLLSFSLLLLLAAGCKPRHEGGGNEIDPKLVAEADVIFNGHVSVMHSTTDPTGGDTENSMVITVDTAISVPEGLSLEPGEQLTLKAKDIKAYKEGDSRTFYAQVSSAGDNMSVTEVGSTEVAADKKTFLQQMDEAKNKKLADKLNERIAKSDLAVSGKVMNISRLATEPETESEHNPEWMVVEIEVSDKFKGDAGQTIRILYPGSSDVAYRNYPRLSQGKEWFYILNRSDAKEAPYRISSPESILPAERYREIKGLLKK